MAANKMRTLINGVEQNDEGLGPDGLPEETQILKKSDPDETFEFVVEGEEQAPPPRKAQKVEVADTDELSQYKADKDNEYEQLKKELEEERSYRQRYQEEQEEAIRYAQAAMEENKRLKTVLDQGANLYTDTVKSKLDTELASAQKAYKEAYESGDSEGMVQAQLKMAEVVAEKRELSRNPPLQRAESSVYSQPIQQQVASSPAVPKTDPKAEAWFQKNSEWFGKDDEMTAIAYAVDKKLMREGVDPRTDEYYRRLDERIRQVFPDRFDNVEQPQQRTVKQQSTVVAPASRSASPKTVKIPPGGAAVARKLGIPIEEYAKQWAAINGRSQ
jgi:hypothetical protein